MNLFLYAVTVLVWGTTWFAIALQLGPVPVLTSIFYRFALAAGLLLPVLAATRRLTPMRRRDHAFVLLQGLCLFSLNFVCFYNATRFVPSGLVSVVFSLATLYNAVAARIFFREPIAPRTLLAAALGVGGLTVLFAPAIEGGAYGSDAPKGLALAALGTLFFSLGNMVSRRNSAAGVPPLTANAWGMTWGSLVLLALIAVTGTPIVAPPDGRYLAALAWLSIAGSVVGFTTYLMLVARIGSGRAAYATVMFPVVALVLSALYEGYVWDARTFVGLGLTMLGNLVIFVGLPRLRRSPRESETPVAR
ncbi:MAG: DMT family transporter [Phyllobacteriaceae bacterium]|nr:DMT family transporter [Phyllobacteriaceae bacterium]